VNDRGKFRDFGWGCDEMTVIVVRSKESGTTVELGRSLPWLTAPLTAPLTAGDARRVSAALAPKRPAP
jgi:hypothetical protein